MSRFSEMNDLIQELIRLRSHIETMRDLGVPPKPGPPATAEEISRLEHRFDLELPPSYREFLGINNGFHNWDSGLDMLSTREMTEEGLYYAELTERKENAWKEGESLVLEGMIVGLSLRSSQLIILDTSKRDKDGECNVVVWEYEERDRMPNFLEFVRSEVQINKEVLAEYEKVYSKSS